MASQPNGIDLVVENTKSGLKADRPQWRRGNWNYDYTSHICTIAQGAGHAIADAWDTYSSHRWKTNIHTLHGALAKVEQLRGVSYDVKESGSSCMPQPCPQIIEHLIRDVNPSALRFNVTAKEFMSYCRTGAC